MQHLTKWNFYKRHSRPNYPKEILTNKGNNNTTLRNINNIDTLVIPNRILIFNVVLLLPLLVRIFFG